MATKSSKQQIVSNENNSQETDHDQQLINNQDLQNSHNNQLIQNNIKQLTTNKDDDDQKKCQVNDDHLNADGVNGVDEGGGDGGGGGVNEGGGNDLIIHENNEENYNLNKKNNLKLPLLNVIITDHDENETDGVNTDSIDFDPQKSNNDPPVVNKTKKFYESDDTFITTIFSQTITSTTVTPTDDDLSYTFEIPSTECPQNDDIQAKTENISQNGEIGCEIDWITVEEATAELSVNESQTENLDNYNEAMISFTDTICLDQDFGKCDEYDDDDYVNNQRIKQDDQSKPNLILENVLMKNNENDQNFDNAFNECAENDLIFENVYANNKQRPSIVIDLYNDEDQDLNDDRYVEPITPPSDKIPFASDKPADQDNYIASYFDQTIIDDDDALLELDKNIKSTILNPEIDDDDDLNDSTTIDSNESSDESDDDDDEDEEERAVENLETSSETTTIITSTKQKSKKSSKTTKSSSTTTKSIIAEAVTAVAEVKQQQSIEVDEELVQHEELLVLDEQEVDQNKSEKALKKKSDSTEKKKKSKKSKKSDSEKENISVSQHLSDEQTVKINSGGDEDAVVVSGVNDDDEDEDDTVEIDNVAAKNEKNNNYTDSYRKNTNFSSASTTNLNNNLISNNSMVMNNPFIINSMLNGASGEIIRWKKPTSTAYFNNYCKFNPQQKPKNFKFNKNHTELQKPTTKLSPTNNKSSQQIAKTGNTYNCNNIAATTNGVRNALPTTPIATKIIPSNMPLYEDDLSNIDVKSLKKKYLMDQPKGQTNKERLIEKDCRVLANREVSVKHLCRSFGDLTALNDEENYDCNPFVKLHRTKSVGDLRKFEQLPIQTGVSVRALRDSYCNLVGLYCGDQVIVSNAGPSSILLVSTGCNNSNVYTNTNNNNNNQRVKNSRVKFGIKQFDMKSSFSKFDALQKKNILHVRSSDAGKAQEKFNGVAAAVEGAEKNCRACTKPVYKMEEVKAERNIWHKNCFKCSECTKQLTVDTYESHESILYCKPHFKALFTPKAVEDNEPVKPRKPEMIIRESQPVELPPDVVRSCDKTDLGLEELHQLNVKSRYQVFENSNHQDESLQQLDRTGVKRSASILSKLAKFQAKGGDIGVTDDSLNGSALDEQPSDDDEDDLDCEEGDDIDLIRAKRAQRERPMSFANMNDIKSRFESGHAITKEERREERKQEIQNIRSRLFLGKQAKIKEMYQQAVLDSEQGIRAVDKKPDMEIGDKAKSIKDRFEKGEIYSDKDESTNNHDEEMAVFEQGIGKKSRSLFMEMDANAVKASSQQASAPVTPSPRTPDVKKQNQPFDDVVKCDEKIDEIKIETADITNKFKFFETYKPTELEKKQFRITPPRDGVVKLPTAENDTDVYVDPDVVRSGETDGEDSIVAEKSHTTTKMLSMFRQMEEEQRNDSRQYDGLKPLKRFTPPPDDGRRIRQRNSESENDCTDSEEEDDDDEEDEDDESEHANQNGNYNINSDYIRSSDKNVDEFLQQAQSAARAKQLRAKFEKWESKEIMREQNNSSVLLYDGEEQSQVETAKAIRAKFESMRETPTLADSPRERIKVNRFVSPSEE